MVDVSTKPWSFKKGIDGAPAGSSALARRVRDGRPSSARPSSAPAGRTPQFRIEMKPVEMDASITQLTLDVDGQIVRYAYGPQVPTTVTWPGPRLTNQVRLQLLAAAVRQFRHAVRGAVGAASAVRPRADPAGLLSRALPRRTERRRAPRDIRDQRRQRAESAAPARARAIQLPRQAMSDDLAIGWFGKLPVIGRFRLPATAALAAGWPRRLDAPRPGRIAGDDARRLEGSRLRRHPPGTVRFPRALPAATR